VDMRNKKNNSFNKLTKGLRRLAGSAIEDYRMIEEDDLIMVCLSGGKDSYALLDVLLGLRRSAPINFDVVAVNLDQKQPGFPDDILPKYLESQEVPFYVLEKDTYSVVKSIIPEGKTTCGLCSRLRRGTLYGFAQEIGATKIALGHHLDDIVETLFLNIFFQGKLKAMPPKLLSDDRKNIVIRPLSYCREKDLFRYAKYRKFPLIPCNLCGSQKNLQRVKIKHMLAGWEKEFPGRIETIFRSIQNVSPSQLGDCNLHNFADMKLERDAGLYLHNIHAVNS